MFEFVHARIAWIAGCLLIWSTYGAVQDDTKAKAIKKLERVEIGVELVELRNVNAPQPNLRDPFNVPHKDGSKSGARAASGMAGALDAALSWTSTHEESLIRLAAPLMPALFAWELARERAVDIGRVPLSPERSGPPPSFRLELEAVSRMDGVGSARINGRLFREGDVIPNSDTLYPPRVQAIEGVQVYVMHRGKVLKLDLDSVPVVQVGKALIPIAAPAASGAGPASPRKSGAALSPRQKNRALRAKGGAP